MVPLTNYSTSPKDVREISDNFQTPISALVPLLPYLPPQSIIWEPCRGVGNLVRGLREAGHAVIGSDITNGQDFLQMQDPGFCWDITLTNPPFSYKTEFIQHCYDLNKPWCLLMPLTSLETLKRYSMFKQHGIELLLLPKRVKFRRYDTTQKQPSFPVAWFTWKILPHPLIFS